MIWPEAGNANSIEEATQLIHQAYETFMGDTPQLDDTTIVAVEIGVEKSPHPLTPAGDELLG